MTEAAERAKFEAWMRRTWKFYPLIRIFENDPGDDPYVSPVAQVAWESWCASTRRPRVAAKLRKMDRKPAKVQQKGPPECFGCGFAHAADYKDCVWDKDIG